MTATLFTQPACGGCIFAAKDLDRAGIDYVARDVRADEAAAAELIGVYAAHRPGLVPTTPVAVISDQVIIGGRTVLGDRVLFGAAEIHQHIRDLAKAAA